MEGSRLEIALKRDLFDARAHDTLDKARRYFGIHCDEIRHVRVLTADSPLGPRLKQKLRNKLTDPVTEISSYSPIYRDFEADWILHVHWLPGVKDNTGNVTKEMIEKLEGIEYHGIYSSHYFVINGDISRDQVEKIGREIETNRIIQGFRVFSPEEYDNERGIGIMVPKVVLDHTPTFTILPEDKITFEGITQLSEERNLYLNPNDIPTIRDFFQDEKLQEKRSMLGLEGPTDVELEYISQARSDHCNHNTFNGRFDYVDKATGIESLVTNLFETTIKRPTKKLADRLPWVRSVLWDNAGGARFDEDHDYVVTGETHNSPSNMEAYGGSITGIVGIYRDPLGTGIGAKLVMGSYGFCTGPRDYDGSLVLKLHPRRLQDGIIEGVRDGGNKSGIPTPFGNYFEEPESIGKTLVFVYAAGIQPNTVNGRKTCEKRINSGDLIVMSGGRVGKDGIHGVTAASEVFDEKTPAGHVQIGDPYTQKKMHDFLLQARDRGYINFITDNGGGGLSSSVGELSREENNNGKSGAEVWLDEVPLKYQGLDQWEIFVSESQERMTITVAPENIDEFMDLSKKHGVESTVIGRLTDDEALHLQYDGVTCGYVPTELLEKQFPQWKFRAEWVEPEERGLKEPDLEDLVSDIPENFRKLLAQTNIASKEWITRQYDHEVQGGSVIKPLNGVDKDMPTDGIVVRPLLHKDRGLAMSQSILQKYSKIDAYHMTMAVIDEAIRSVLAVGATSEHLSGIDNFCWPSIQESDDNPDARFKAAQLVRSCWALQGMQYLYGQPLLSGKDSMYCDGKFTDRETGKTVRVSGLETLQYTMHSIVDDLSKCRTPDAKEAGNLIYVIGETKDELGGSEYYKMLGEVGLNVPKTDARKNKQVYQRFEQAREYIRSAKAVKMGGIGVSLMQMAGGGKIGVDISLENLLTDGSVTRDDQALFSESTGRFIVEVKEEYKDKVEEIMGDNARCIGRYTEDTVFKVHGLDGNRLIEEDIYALDKIYKSTHGDR